MSTVWLAGTPIVHEPSLSHAIMIYVRNERGVTLPLFIRNDDTVDAIWQEVVNSLAVNERTLRGKGLHVQGRLLHNQAKISDAGIRSHTVITLEKIREPSIQRQESFDIKTDSQLCSRG